MDLRPNRQRMLVAHARESAFVPRTRAILARLGYRIISPEDRERLAAGEGAPGEVWPAHPDLHLVDERLLAELPESDGERETPVIVLTGRHGVTASDPRIVGAIMRPAGVHDLYRLLQQVFEDHPRTTPRVPTHLRATCRRDGRSWDASVLSLSENGCLLRSGEAMTLGSHVELEFSLPHGGEGIALRAEAAYQLLPDLGLVFSSVDPPCREAISRFVMETIAPIA